MQSPFLFTVFITMLIVVIIAVILEKVRRAVMSSDSYKRSFAKSEAQFVETVREVFDPLKEKIFADLNEHLKREKGDLLEIGIGAGQNFYFYPVGTSLIAVDSNPHVEQLLKAKLMNVGDRIQLKKFVVASAEHMSCTRQVGVEDNSVAAVVCTFVMYSPTKRESRKILREVKRVLMPGGRFYFLEHVAGKPWTFQYLLQQFFSKSLIWPTMLNGCRCDRETLSRIEETGFKMVQAEKIWVQWTPKIYAATKDALSRIGLFIFSSVVFGFAEKGRGTEEKKVL